MYTIKRKTMSIHKHRSYITDESFRLIAFFQAIEIGRNRKNYKSHDVIEEALKSLMEAKGYDINVDSKTINRFNNFKKGMKPIETR